MCSSDLIQAFGDRLTTRYGQSLPEEGLDYLSRMLVSAGRMRKLIDDLLAYSRVATQAKPFVPTSLGEVLAEVLSDLELSIEQVGGKVDLGALPTIDADPSQMRQLFQNLLGNALKFHKKNEPPVVKIGANTGNGLCTILVEDNGIGFDEKYLDKIFTIFQRLHGRQEYEGTGVGLAVCRRIVERHGGSITARSKTGEGACFIVSLPLKHT